MRVMIIDEDVYFRTLVRKFLERDLPGAELVEYDPLTGGRPGGDFEWDAFDALLLNHELGGAETGLDWLKALAGRGRRLPPTLYMRELGEDGLDRAALGLGADGILDKREVGGNRLASAIETVISCRARGVKVPLPAAPGPVPEEERRPAIDGYKIGALIGKGVRTRVYLADRRKDHLTVVLKVIPFDLANDHAYAKRFVEEAELVSGVHSPYVVEVFEQGFTDAYGFMAMEFFPRGDLKQRIEIGIPPGDAVHCLANIAYGLEAIHEVGIVHRDLKPANVMFRSDDTLALADFGISRRLAAESELVKSGTVLGTPHYMSPEQGQGKPADVRNDIYSLGIIFYEMLVGEKPYNAETPAKIVYKHIHDPVPELPRSLRRYQPLIDRLLAKDPAARYPSAGALVDDL